MSLSLHDAQMAVNDFHRKMGFEFYDDLRPSSEEGPLTTCATSLQIHATHLLNMGKFYGDGGPRKDLRYLRAHLMCEELGEVLEALEKGDEVALFDGLCDLIYVILGTACIYSLPIASGFEEVHRSNMTKAPQADDPDKERLRQKGPDYSAPDLKGILERWRKR